MTINPNTTCLVLDLDDTLYPEKEFVMFHFELEPGKNKPAFYKKKDLVAHLGIAPGGASTTRPRKYQKIFCRSPCLGRHHYSLLAQAECHRGGRQ